MAKFPKFAYAFHQNDQILILINFSDVNNTCKWLILTQNSSCSNEEYSFTKTIKILCWIKGRINLVASIFSQFGNFTPFFLPESKATGLVVKWLKRNQSGSVCLGL